MISKKSAALRADQNALVLLPPKEKPVRAKNQLGHFSAAEQKLIDGKLTERERQLFELVQAGYSTKQIARMHPDLHLRNIEGIRGHINSKLDLLGFKGRRRL